MFPRLFSIGNFTLHTYGLLVALGFIAGVYVARHLASRFGQDGEKVFNLAVYLALAAMVGAKLFLVIQDWRYYFAHPADLVSGQFLESAGIYYGGLVMALVVLTLYVWRQKLHWLSVGDAIAPGVAIGQAIGRWGCFSAGCCWGKPTHVPWAVTFTSLYAHQTVGVPLNIPLHPTQLYESFCDLALFVVLLWLAKRRAFTGQLTAVYLMTYAVIRFVIDYFRYYEPQALLFNGHMTDAQLTSIGMFALGLTILVLQLRRPAPHAALEAAAAVKASE